MNPSIRRRQFLASAAVATLARPAVLHGAAMPDVPTITLPGEIVLPLGRSGDGKVALRITASNPPPDFNPLGASAEELARFGLPARPRGQGVALAGWEALMRRLRFAHINLISAAPPPPPPPAPPIAGAVAGAFPHAFSLHLGGDTLQSSGSNNWCGALVRSVLPNRFKGVTGTWTVPGIDSRPPAGVSPRRQCRVSQWIGLDGSDPNSRSLPQIGTLRTLHGPHDDLKMWWQWWIADTPGQAPVTIAGLNLAEGDKVTAKLAVSAPTAVDFIVMVERAAGRPIQFVNFNVAAAITETGSFTGGLAVEGRVAEWVVERPLSVARRHGRRSARLYPLPVFTDPVTFSGCRAVMDDGTTLDLDRARLLRIADWEDVSTRGNEFPLHGQMVCQVGSKTTDGFEVRYTGPQPL
jgi:Peptidase A4 family